MPFSLPEILIVLVIVLVLFGAKRLPELGRSMGSGMKNFKEAVSGGDDDAEAEHAQLGAAQPAAPAQTAAAQPAAPAQTAAQPAAPAQAGVAYPAGAAISQPGPGSAAPDVAQGAEQPGSHSAPPPAPSTEAPPTPAAGAPPAPDAPAERHPDTGEAAREAHR